MEEYNRIKSPQQSTPNAQDISLSYSKYREQEKCGPQGKKTIRGDDLKMTQILELTDKDLKVAIIINISKDLKDALMNERMGNPIKK